MLNVKVVNAIYLRTYTSRHYGNISLFEESILEQIIFLFKMILFRGIKDTQMTHEYHFHTNTKVLIRQYYFITYKIIRYIMFK